MKIEDAKKLQELMTNREINEKILNGWKSSSGLSLYVTCLGSSTVYTKPGFGKSTCDELFERDIVAALEAQIKRFDDQIAAL